MCWYTLGLKARFLIWRERRLDEEYQHTRKQGFMTMFYDYG
jgi:hypothetical protein